jgi:hypothetical protein
MSSVLDIASAMGSITDILNQLDGLTSAESSSALNGSTVSKSFAASKMMVSVNRNQSINRSESDSMHGSLTRSSGFSRPMIAKDVGLGPIGLAPAAPEVADPNRLIAIDLVESETRFLLSIPSTAISSENTDEYANVKAQNAKYKELLASNRDSSKYISKHAQTLTHPVKNKEISITGNAMVDCEVNTDSWDIYDAFVVEEEEELTEKYFI